MGAKLVNSDEASIQSIPNVRVVRIASFLGVVAPDECDAVLAAKTLNAKWSNETNLIGSAAVREWLRNGPFDGEEFLVRKGEAQRMLSQASARFTGEYYWPLQTHGSMGPSCAVADVH